MNCLMSFTLASLSSIADLVSGLVALSPRVSGATGGAAVDALAEQAATICGFSASKAVMSCSKFRSDWVS